MSTFVPLRFGPAHRTVLGLLQQPASSAQGSGSFLLARPIGLAATRSASMFRVLSDRLCRQGATVMRFDYHGTGDAPGDEVTQSLEGWTRDVQEAHHALGHAVTAAHTDWFGMGLGANLMALAALRSPRPPRRLVLWEPIEHGPAHIDDWLAAHRRELAMQLADTWPRLVARGMAAEPEIPGSVLGFDIGQQLHNDLLNLPALAPWLRMAVERGAQVTLCGAPERLARWTQALPDNVRTEVLQVPLTSQTNWLSSEAMGAAIVPPELGRILEILSP